MNNINNINNNNINKNILKPNYLGINPEYDSVNEPMYLNNLEDIKKYCKLKVL